MTQAANVLVTGRGPADITILLHARVPQNLLATRKTQEPR
jgi:hypothetical protein